MVSVKLNHQREIAQAESAPAAVDQMREEIDGLHSETEVKRGELESAAVVAGNLLLLLLPG